MSTIPPILLVGCGRMGSAMLAGWRERGLAPSVAVDPAPSAASLAGPDLTVVRIAPRPPFPEQHAVRRPIARELDAWWTAATSALEGAA